MLADASKLIHENLTVILASMIVVLFGIYHWTKRPKNFPPGPLGMPFLGVAHKLSSRAELALTEMAKEYGPVMGVKLLGNFTVVLNDLESIHEALVKQGQVFAGRPEAGIFHIFTQNRGVIAIDGPKWKENRKFGMVIFRKLGSGKKIMEERIVDEMVHMCSALQLIKGKSFDISNLVTHAVANVVCGFAFGQRFDYSDLKFISVAKSLVDWFGDNADAFLLMLMAPFLHKFPHFSALANSLKNATNKLYTLLLPIVDDHRKSLDAYEYRDFVDAYLLEIEKRKNDEERFYTEEELKGYIRDLFVAGTDTTSTTIKWCLILLVNRPEAQKKIQKEIDTIVGPDARPKMAHVDQMHYLKAFVHELMRHRTPGPLGLAHRTLSHTKLMGYDIPKNTQILTNFWAIHHDPAIWDEPEEFRPERFLDENGNFQKSQYLIPFSIGSRYCMGEAIAKMVIYFFIVTALQRFHLEHETSDGPQIPEECERSGQFLIAPRFKMQVRERFSRAKSIKEYQQSMWD